MVYAFFSLPLTYVRPVYIDFFILFLGLESSFTPAWRTFKHSLYNLTPAERTIKSRKAYIARVSPDGQIMVIAMNQKFAAHNRVMFYSLSQSAVAVIADLKGCGARLNTHGGVPSGRSDVIMKIIIIIIIIIMMMMMMMMMTLAHVVSGAVSWRRQNIKEGMITWNGISSGNFVVNVDWKELIAGMDRSRREWWKAKTVEFHSPV